MNANEEQKQQYNDYVKKVTPTHNLPCEMFKAFVTGGVICLIGQLIRNMGTQMGMDQDTAGAWCSILLVFLSILLTGLNIYPSIAKWGGAGALVPITGFANGVAAPAIEYKKEGFWYRQQNFHHRRAGNPVWNLYQLGAGASLLGRQVFWNVVKYHLQETAQDNNLTGGIPPVRLLSSCTKGFPQAAAPEK